MAVCVDKYNTTYDMGKEWAREWETIDLAPCCPKGETRHVHHTYHTRTPQIPHTYTTHTRHVHHTYHKRTPHIPHTCTTHIYHTRTPHIPHIHTTHTTHEHHTYHTQTPHTYSTHTTHVHLPLHIHYAMQRVGDLDLFTAPN